MTRSRCPARVKRPASVETPARRSKPKPEADEPRRAARKSGGGGGGGSSFDGAWIVYARSASPAGQRQHTDRRHHQRQDHRRTRSGVPSTSQWQPWCTASTIGRQLDHHHRPPVRSQRRRNVPPVRRLYRHMDGIEAVNSRQHSTADLYSRNWKHPNYAKQPSTHDQDPPCSPLSFHGRARRRHRIRARQRRRQRRQ